MSKPSEEWTVAEAQAWGRSGGKVTPSAPAKHKGQAQASQPAKSRLALQFESIWQNINGQPLVEEWQGIPGRQFRFDYTALDADSGRVLAIVELEGLTRQGGRHQRMEGFERDIDKYFLASVVQGWPVIRLTRRVLKKPENLVLLREFIDKRRAELNRTA